MLIYHAHPETGVYLGSSAAAPDPQEHELARSAVFEPLAAEATAVLQAAMRDAAQMADADLAKQAVEAARLAFEAAMVAAAAARDAVAPTLWLIPAHAYEDAPPAFGFDERAVRRSGAWVVEPIPAPIEDAPPEEDLAQIARSRRTSMINQIRWMIDRHRDEEALQRPTTLSPAEFLALLAYVQDLRDVPEQSGFPNEIDWPQLPAGIASTEA